LLSRSIYAQKKVLTDDNEPLQRVILLNSDPWEVLLARDGEIIAKLKYLPFYFEHTKYKQKPEKSRFITRNKPKESAATFTEPLKDFGDIYFLPGSALLRKKQIQLLNNLANILKAGKDKKITLLGFTNEPDMIASILGKRRMDAVITYLKIKGVDVDRQVERGSTVKGVNSKVVYVFRD